MGLVEEFLERHMRDHQCDHCGRHFPKSVLVGMDYPFKGFNGHFCVVCCHKIYDLMGVCEECGEEFPKSHLFKRVGNNESLCKRCLDSLFEDEG